MTSDASPLISIIAPPLFQMACASCLCLRRATCTACPITGASPPTPSAWGVHTSRCGGQRGGPSLSTWGISYFQVMLRSLQPMLQHASCFSAHQGPLPYLQPSSFLIGRHPPCLCRRGCSTASPACSERCRTAPRACWHPTCPSYHRAAARPLGRQQAPALMPRAVSR